jgi:hypothetical protein
MRMAKGPNRPPMRFIPKTKRTHITSVQRVPRKTAAPNSNSGGLTRTLGSVKIVPAPITQRSAMGVRKSPAMICAHLGNCPGSRDTGSESTGSMATREWPHPRLWGQGTEGRRMSAIETESQRDGCLNSARSNTNGTPGCRSCRPSAKQLATLVRHRGPVQTGENARLIEVRRL